MAAAFPSKSPSRIGKHLPYNQSMKLAHFYTEPIQPVFDTPPTYQKTPPCPNGFIWRDQTFRIINLRSQWVDYARRGRMAKNMQPAHAAVASRRGSWGVGRFSFEVEVEGGRVFVIYYDRAPKDAFDRIGSWFVFGEA